MNCIASLALLELWLQNLSKTLTLDEDFLENTSLFGKTLFILLSTTFARMKYYHAWLLADAICNASGLGFNGYTASGKAKWDLISNVDIFKFEVWVNIYFYLPNGFLSTFFFSSKLVWDKFTWQHWQLEQIHEPLASFCCIWTHQSVPNCSYILFVCHMARILPGLLHHISRWSALYLGGQIRSPLGSSLFHGKPCNSAFLRCPNFHYYTSRYGLSDL